MCIRDRDLVIPDVTYLIKNKDRVKGIVITHGHEDHIGAIPYILKQINLPIYATKLTIELIKNKLEEHHLLNSTKLHVVEAGKTVNFGKIKAEFIRSSHSIPDAVMIAMHTPVGVVLHTGDFKVDYTPIDDKIMDLGRIAELGNNGILALLSDSTCLLYTSNNNNEEIVETNTNSDPNSTGTFFNETGKK